MSEQSVAYDALNLARQTERDIGAHEKLCAERYDNIHCSIDEIKGLLKWVGGAGFTVIIGLLGWSMSQQFNSSTARIEALQIELQKSRSIAVASAPAPGVPLTR